MYQHPLLNWQLSVGISQLCAGVYHNAVVTSQLVIPVINQAQFVKSQVSVGTVIFAVTSVVELASNTATLTPFCLIVNAPLPIVGLFTRSL